MSAPVRRLLALVCLGVALHAADAISVVATQPLANETGLVPAVVTFTRLDPTVPMSVPFRITGSAASDQHGGHVSGVRLVDAGNGYHDHSLSPVPVLGNPLFEQEVPGYTGGAPVIIATGVGGRITSATAAPGGSGYDPLSPPEVAVSDSNGAGAILTANVRGFLTSVFPTSLGGLSYQVGDVLTIVDGSPSVPATVLVTSVTVPDGAITGIQMQSPGAGYQLTSSSQVVSPVGGHGSGAQVVINLDFAVYSLSVVAEGSGYVNPIISIAPPGAGTQAGATAVVAGSPLLEVTVSGMGGRGVPMPTATSTVAGAQLVPVVEDGAVTRIVVENGGSGIATPAVVFPGGTTPASARVRVRDGVIIGVTLEEAGSGYSGTSVDVTLAGGTTPATIRGFVVGGKIISANVIAGGSGFPTPAITIASGAGTAGVGATAVATVEGGRITAVDVTSGGSGYSTVTSIAIDDNTTTDDDSSRGRVDFQVSAADYYVLAEGEAVGARSSVVAWLDPAGTGDLVGAVFFDRADTTTTLRIMPLRNGVGGGRELQVAIDPPAEGEDYVVVNELSVAQVRIGDMDDVVSTVVTRPVAYPTPPSLSQELYPHEVEGRAEFRVDVVGDTRQRRISLEFTPAEVPEDGIALPMAEIDTDCLLAANSKSIPETVNDFTLVANKELRAPYTYGPARAGDTRIWMASNAIFVEGSVVMFEGTRANTRISGIYVVTAKEKSTDEVNASIYITPALHDVECQAGSTRVRVLGTKLSTTDAGDGSLSLVDAYGGLDRLYMFAFPYLQTQTRGARSLRAKLVEVDDYQVRTPNVAGLTIADTLVIARIGHGGNAGQPATGGSFLVTLSAPFPRDVEVPFDVLGSSTAVLSVDDDLNTLADETVVGDCSVAGVDPSTRRGTLIIPAGATTGAIMVTPSGSASASVAKTVDVKLAASYDYQFGPQGTSAANTMASVTVAPTPLTNDPDGVGILPALPIRIAFDTVVQHGAEPATNAQVKMVLVDASGVALPAGYVTEVPISVAYTISGTAAANINYVALSGQAVMPAGAREVIIPIQVKDDGLATDDRNLVLTLRGGVGYQVGANGAVTVTIGDGAPQLSISTLNSAVRPQVMPATNGRFEVTNTKPSQQSLAVNYTVTGDAVAGTDYSPLTGSLILPPSATTFPIEVTPYAGSSAKTLVLTLSASAGSLYRLGTGSATMAIQVAARPTTTALEPVYVSVTRVRDAAEDPLTNGAFRLSLTNATGGSLTAPMGVDYPITFTATGSAVKGVNYLEVATPVTIPAGLDHVDVPVVPMNDHQPGGTQVVIILPDSMYPPSLGSATIAVLAAADEPGDNGVPRPTVGSGGSGGCGVGSGVGLILTGFGVALAARLRRRRDAA